MSLLNLGLTKKYLTNNQTKKRDSNGKLFNEFVPVKYRWTHGATDLHLGDGLLIYSKMILRFRDKLICFSLIKLSICICCF